MKKRIVITGATGFVGGALARRLVTDGYSVVGVARPGSSKTRFSEIEWVEGDVTRPETLSGIFAGADYVIHSAGMLGQAGVPEEKYHELHLGGTRNVLTAVARQALQARVLHISSPGVLGPIVGSPADESTPLAPSNPYERSKAEAERVALDFVEQGLDVVVTRPEFIYGVGDTHVLGLFRAVQRGIFFYIGRGNYTCHPTYIADAVDGVIRCLERGRTGEIYHITGSAPVTFREFGETIANELNVKPPRLMLPRPIALLGAISLEIIGKLTGLTPPLSRTGVAFFSEDRRFSWQKAHNELDYIPQFDLQTGVAETVTWYRSEGYL